jgi:hypothetical protein
MKLSDFSKYHRDYQLMAFGFVISLSAYALINAILELFELLQMHRIARFTFFLTGFIITFVAAMMMKKTLRVQRRNDGRPGPSLSLRFIPR